MEEDISFVNSLYGQANEKPSIKIDIIFVLIGLFFLFVIIWASFASIDEIARGQGKVIPANKIQTIQSIDGGTISEILVKEGEHVKKNQPLMKIDTTRVQASLEETKEKYLALLAKKTRLKTQLKYKPFSKKIPKLKFPKELIEINSEFVVIETNILKNSINELESSLRILKFQLYQKKQELKELNSKKKQLKKSLKLITQQRNTIKKMAISGSKSKIDLLKIESSYNKIKGDLESTLLSIPRSKLAIAEAKSKIEEKINKFKTNTITELQKTQKDLKTLKARLVSDNDKLNKTIIRSPVDGIIQAININTIGGVVKSGDNLIDIVPDSKILLVEAKISPRDIAFINPTQRAVVKITAYDFSIYGGLEGKIVAISADSFKDKDNPKGGTYYKVLIKTTKNYLEKDGKKYPIIPGMVASVDIITGKKTIMDYILKPILKTKEGALHER